MIKELTDLPAGVIGFETAGKLHAEDYRDILLPAVTGRGQALPTCRTSRGDCLGLRGSNTAPT